jgi:GT2 family glycosyltransferase
MSEATTPQPDECSDGLPAGTGLGHDAGELRVEVLELQSRLDRLTALARRQRTESEALRSKLRQAELAAREANRRVTEILNSNIWRTLVWGGRVMLHLRKRALLLGIKSRSLMARMLRVGRDRIEAYCDIPVDGGLLSRRGQVHGWACALSGVKHVAILIGDRPVEPVQTGISRDDVARHLPGFPQAERSGFQAQFECADFPAGAQELRIRITAASGLTSTIRRRFSIEHRNEYDIWRQRNRPENRRAEILDNIGLFRAKPLITIVTPVFKTPLEYLWRCLESVSRQYYPNWQHVLVDDGSGDPALREMLQEAARAEPRIRVAFLTGNRGIAAATNEALQLAKGEFVGFLDHDDELSPDALYEVANELNYQPEWDLFYSDEDKISADGTRHFDAFFKPDWSPDLVRSMNYVCHFLVCRRSLLGKAGYLRDGFDGSQDFDLVLRLTEHTTRIRRIPKILYHWRACPGSTALVMGAKPEASQAGLKALNDHLARTSPGARASELTSCQYRVRYPLRERPRVAAIIPSAGNRLLEGALRGLLEQTDYPDIEVLVVDNSHSKGKRVRRVVAGFERAARPLRVLDCRGLPFNFSLLCNRAARATAADYLLFLNDDTSVIHADWLEAMMEHAQRPDVGAVGGLLLFPDNRIQHAGVLMGVWGLAGHSFRLLDSRETHYFALPALTRNCLAVTGACLLTRAKVFWQVQGFEEPQLPTAFQDVDLCLKIHEQGYRIIYTPHARLYHHESATKGKTPYQSEIDYMKARWERYIDDDPYYNPNLTRAGEGYTLNV